MWEAWALCCSMSLFCGFWCPWNLREEHSFGWVNPSEKLCSVRTPLGFLHKRRAHPCSWWDWKVTLWDNVWSSWLLQTSVSCRSGFTKLSSGVVQAALFPGLCMYLRASHYWHSDDCRVIPKAEWDLLSHCCSWGGDLPPDLPSVGRMCWSSCTPVVDSIFLVQTENFFQVYCTWRFTS